MTEKTTEDIQNGLAQYLLEKMGVSKKDIDFSQAEGVANKAAYGVAFESYIQMVREGDIDASLGDNSNALKDVMVALSASEDLGCNRLIAY